MIQRSPGPEKPWIRNLVFSMALVFSLFIIHVPRADAQSLVGGNWDLDFDGSDRTINIVTGVIVSLAVVVLVWRITASADKEGSEWYSGIPGRDLSLTAGSASNSEAKFFLDCGQTGSDFTLACW